jgi:yecA family protein
MRPEEIRSELETSRALPERAIWSATREPDAIASAVLAALDDATNGVYLMPRQSQLLFFGVHALGAAGYQGLYRPLLRFLQQPESEVEPILGDATTESIPRVIVSVFDGDVAPLVQAIENRAADGIVRWILFSALARLTFDGKVDRGQTIALLDRFDRDRLGGDDSTAWMGWQEAVTLLGLADMRDRVRAAYADGRIDASLVEVDEWETEFQRICANPNDPENFRVARTDPIGDPVAALHWLTWRDDAGEAAEDDTEPPEAKRRDPAANVALAEDEIEWLSGFLGSTKVPPSTMTFEEVDGFLAALAAGPVTVSPAEYLPVIWGAEDGSGPKYDSGEQAEYVVGLLTRHCNTIALRLGARFPYVPFIDDVGDEFAARGWSTSFLRGVALHPDAWRPLLDDAEHVPPLGIIFALAADHEEEPDRPPTRDELDEVIANLPLAIAGIHAYWRGGLPGRREPFRRRKIGRNEPCPCGSGKKYKRCCGAA